MTSFRTHQLRQNEESFYAREPPPQQYERALELELWMINSTRQIKDLVAVLSKHESALTSAPVRLRRSLRKEINKAEAILAKVAVAKQTTRRKKLKKQPKTDKQKQRHYIVIEHELTKARAHIDLQDEIHRNTLEEFSRERDALENKIRAQRRVIDQILSKSTEDKEMLSTIIRKMHVEQDDEAWPSTLLLSHEANPWNNRMYDVPNKRNVSIQRRPPIHMPLNFTNENIELWREHPLILPNFIALNMYSRQSENTVCNITDPTDTWEGLTLVERGEQCKRDFMFHMRNEHLGAGRVKVHVSFDGRCSPAWMYPSENAMSFGRLLLEGLECIENRSARDGSTNMIWDLVFTPGGRMSIEMVAEEGGKRISMVPMKQATLIAGQGQNSFNSAPPTECSFSAQSDRGSREAAEETRSQYSSYLKGEVSYE
jgi:hypothetical protein